MNGTPEAIVTEAVDSLGGLTTLVNCAGVLKVVQRTEALLSSTGRVIVV